MPNESFGSEKPSMMRRRLSKHPGFLHRNAGPPTYPSAWRVNLQALASAIPVAIAFVLITLVCAFLYWAGSQAGWGIRPTFNEQTPSQSTTFGDCLYFSVVTIATLGYGDYRPESLSKGIASTEVLLGITLMGIFVAQLVSGQATRMTARLLRGQLNNEIQRFRSNISNFKRPIVLQRGAPSDELYAATGLAKSIARYWRYEADSIEFIAAIPLRAAGRLLGDLVDLLNDFSEANKGIGRKDIHWRDLAKLRSLTDSILLVSTVLAERIQDDGLSHSFKRVCDLVQSLRTQFGLIRSAPD
jgi:hypothetical protein